ncbi:hypothetical protein [Streptomyces sp. CBMA156]|uniref:hypothetical protein n=1 Tax=Streptomyces sp. CBMA156 TaxID=1930280 RepID=UPI001662153E|nr:hypothetical protein [Streptomyces sp. CBMA156]MBD0670048.1 hypothetical protein [Streptomyces sp. CBMA156]
MYLNRLPDAILRVLDADPNPQRWDDVRILLGYDGPHQAAQFYDVVWKMYGLQEGETAYVTSVSTEDDPEICTNPLLALTKAGIVHTEDQRRARRELVAANEAEWDTAAGWNPVDVEGFTPDFTRVTFHFQGVQTYAVWERGERLMRYFAPESDLLGLWGWSHRIDPDETDAVEAAALWGPLGKIIYDRSPRATAREV